VATVALVMIVAGCRGEASDRPAAPVDAAETTPATTPAAASDGASNGDVGPRSTAAGDGRDDGDPADGEASDDDPSDDRADDDGAGDDLADDDLAGDDGAGDRGDDPAGGEASAPGSPMTEAEIIELEAQLDEIDQLLRGLEGAFADD
jgi:hypothetical protein